MESGAQCFSPRYGLCCGLSILSLDPTIAVDHRRVRIARVSKQTSLLETKPGAKRTIQLQPFLVPWMPTMLLQRHWPEGKDRFSLRRAVNRKEHMIYNRVGIPYSLVKYFILSRHSNGSVANLFPSVLPLIARGLGRGSSRTRKGHRKHQCPRPHDLQR